MTPTRHRRRHDERGSAVTVWAVLIVTVLTLIIGIAVDLSAQVQAKRHASDVAAQAARLAGQQLDADRFLDSGGTLTLANTTAREAALDYIEQCGMTGQVVITGGTDISVTTTARYTPVFLSSIGVGTLEVTGSAHARAVRALNGTER
jgi:Flp pilus assembly protein TadG